MKCDTGRRPIVMRRGLVALALIVAAACNDDPTPTGAGSKPPPDASTSITQQSSDPPVTAPATGTSRSATLRCGMVGFTPNSEDAASEITATGLSCEEAGTFVRVAGERTSSGGPDRLDVSGYRCVRTSSEQDPLPLSRYECTNGDRKVTFVRS